MNFRTPCPFSPQKLNLSTLFFPAYVTRSCHVGVTTGEGQISQYNSRDVPCVFGSLACSLKVTGSPRLGRAVAHAVSRWLPTAVTRVGVRASMWGLWWRKRYWGRFSPSTSVSSANHSTNFSIIIITRGWHNRPISGRGAEWTQLDSTPGYTNLILYLSILLHSYIHFYTQFYSL
jgi:hypothetical protein